MTITVIDAIKAGRYENKVPYSLVREPVDEDKVTVRQAREHKEMQLQRERDQRRLNREEEGRLYALFRSDLESEHGVGGHPKAQKLFEMAWADGHSSGYEEVACCYADLAELVKA